MRPSHCITIGKDDKNSKILISYKQKPFLASDNIGVFHCNLFTTGCTEHPMLSVFPPFRLKLIGSLGDICKHILAVILSNNLMWCADISLLDRF